MCKSIIWEFSLWRKDAFHVSGTCQDVRVIVKEEEHNSRYCYMWGKFSKPTQTDGSLELVN